jgi:endo-1,4-beta-xylanase
VSAGPTAPDRRAPGRRAVVASLGALALSACGRESRGQSEPYPPPRPLRAACPAPAGCAVTAERLADPADAVLIAAQFSQLTPEWQLKMEYVLAQPGRLRFDAPDAIARFAHAHGLRFFGHTLAWYAEKPEAFVRLDGQGAAFAKAYGDYITAVVGRYQGLAVGWDVVNEAVAEDGDGLRECLWSRNLGRLDYMHLAFEHARAADPGAVLLINDYNLESRPKKRATFLRLVEDLIKAGAPVGGLGTQSHIAADLAPGAVREAIADLARLGLPIHVSELDISLRRGRGLFTGEADLEQRQLRLAEEVGEAFAALPPGQRFALTVWGLRDPQSWLRGERENPAPPWDAPLMFDDTGRAKPVLAALEAGLARP